MGVPLEGAHRIRRRPLGRPLQAGKLGAQTQRMGWETPAQERFTRSPGRPSKETRGGRGGVVRASPQARRLPVPSPPLPTPTVLGLRTHIPLRRRPAPGLRLASLMLSPQGQPAPGVALSPPQQQQQQLQNQGHGWDVVGRGGE